MHKIGIGRLKSATKNMANLSKSLSTMLGVSTFATALSLIATDINKAPEQAVPRDLAMMALLLLGTAFCLVLKAPLAFHFKFTLISLLFAQFLLGLHDSVPSLFNYTIE